MNKLLSCVFVPLCLLSLGASPHKSGPRRSLPGPGSGPGAAGAPATPAPPGPPGPTGPPAGASLAAEPAPPATPPAAAPPPGACPSRVAAGVRRTALARTLDAGLGSWLRGVDVEPRLDGKRFQGWLVRRLHPEDPCFADVDLRAGDVVSRINRRPIERPEQAFAVWTALRTAREIVVDYTRSGEARTFRIDVVD
jgi:hypothetical protein